MNIFSKTTWAMIVGSVCLWGLSVDHIARATEKEITASLQDFSESTESGLIKPTLIEYKRSFLSSTLSVSLASDHPSIDSMLEDIVITGKVQHGPLIITDQKLVWKTTHLDFSLHNRVNVDINEEIVSAHMSVDYSLRRQVGIKLNSLNLDVAGIELASRDIFMNYDFQPDDKFPKELEFSLPDLTLSDGENQAQISDGKVSLALSSTRHERDSVRFMAKDASLDIMDVINKENIKFAVEVAFTDKDVVSFETDLVSKDNKKSSTKIKMDNLNLDSFKDTFVGFINYRNLSEQIDWTLEDSAYSPDGQDRLYELLSRLDENGNDITDMLANRVLTPNKSRIQITQYGNNNLSADLTFLGLSNIKRQSPWSNSLAGTIKYNKPFSADSWFNQLEDYTYQAVIESSQANNLAQAKRISADISN
ncbi:MAG: Unknown protein [uncultured Thiotrichaceae bacterium]|uniref:Uncharacterized protein n=1 Tax=uncultured Thiotrichaceae bacterium TaxID=298394 RepID=A0A6S6SL40_9GAMM|nr:MAG: Unknown protein [uncultured Thiotrichaceae bacterium]